MRAWTRRAVGLLLLRDLVRVTPLPLVALMNWSSLESDSDDAAAEEESPSDVEPSQPRRTARAGLRRAIALRRPGLAARPLVKTKKQLLWAGPLGSQHSDPSQTHRWGKCTCKLTKMHAVRNLLLDTGGIQT